MYKGSLRSLLWRDALLHCPSWTLLQPHPNWPMICLALILLQHPWVSTQSFFSLPQLSDTIILTTIYFIQ